MTTASERPNLVLTRYRVVHIDEEQGGSHLMLRSTWCEEDYVLPEYLVIDAPLGQKSGDAPTNLRVGDVVEITITKVAERKG